MNIEELKMDHFENFEELIKTCKMWIRDDDIDAYYRFFEFNCMKTFVIAYEKEKEENKKWKDYVVNDLENQITERNNKIFKLEAELEKEKEKNKELESDIQQKNFEIKCLNSDIKNMYCEEGIIAILEDNFDLSREEAIQILEEE